MARRILLGRIAGAHGVRGELRIRSFTAEPASIAAYGPLVDKGGTREFRLALRGRVRGDELIAHIEGVADRNAAEALRGTELYVDRDRLPPVVDTAEYYEADLVGLAVVDRAGNPLGTVVTVADFGAGPVLEIRRPDGGELLLPFSDAAVPTVDLAGGRLVAVPPAEIELRPDDAAGAPAEFEAGRAQPAIRRPANRRPATRRRSGRR
jgi:16S rRNA processing protein RimM